MLRTEELFTIQAQQLLAFYPHVYNFGKSSNNFLFVAYAISVSHKKKEQKKKKTEKVKKEKLIAQAEPNDPSRLQTSCRNKYLRKTIGNYSQQQHINLLTSIQLFKEDSETKGKQKARRKITATNYVDDQGNENNRWCFK